MSFMLTFLGPCRLTCWPKFKADDIARIKQQMGSRLLLPAPLYSSFSSQAMQCLEGSNIKITQSRKLWPLLVSGDLPFHLPKNERSDFSFIFNELSSSACCVILASSEAELEGIVQTSPLTVAVHENGEATTIWSWGRVNVTWPEVNWWPWPYEVMISIFLCVSTRGSRWCCYFCSNSVSSKVIGTKSLVLKSHHLDFLSSVASFFTWH